MVSIPDAIVQNVGKLNMSITLARDLLFNDPVIKRPNLSVFGNKNNIKFMRSFHCPVCHHISIHLDKRVRSGRTNCTMCKNNIVYIIHGKRISIQVDMGREGYKTEQDLISGS